MMAEPGGRAATTGFAGHARMPCSGLGKPPLESAAETDPPFPLAAESGRPVARSRFCSEIHWWSFSGYGFVRAPI